MQKLIGRKKEIAELQRLTESDKPEFIAIFGRRRVGKTYLINQVFRGKLAFSMSGIIEGTSAQQFEAFTQALDFHGYKMERFPKTWIEAFGELRKFLTPRVESGESCIVFLDEIPSLDFQRSGFVKALGYFWNSWASLYDNFKLIVCGSSTSWMIENIIDSKAGLHNRITYEMHLHQFTLGEVAEYLESRNFRWTNLSILQTYMTMGGVAYYLSLLNENESLVQNIDRLFFGAGAPLQREYERLFKTLFNSADPYLKIIKVLTQNQSGLTRKEISDKLKIEGRTLSEYLNNLVNSDFIRYFTVKNNKIQKNGGIYQLLDCFIYFFQTFVDGNMQEPDYWAHHINTPTVNNWYGLAFEKVCLLHIQQIKKALHFDTIATQTYSWRTKKEEANGRGAQIDLVIDRADGIANICEIKYSKYEYTLDKNEYEKIENRVSKFESETRPENGTNITIITTKGLEKNKYTNEIQSVVTLDDLISS